MSSKTDRSAEAAKALPARSVKVHTGNAPTVPSRAVRHRSLTGERPPKIYGKIGNLEVRLARTRTDVRRAQKLRFEVFYREMSAVPGTAARLTRRDIDGYDSVCDHLLVVDHGTGHHRPRVVGTYRMLRQDVADSHTGFYTQSEFNLAPLIAARGPGCRFMELGRSCVLQPYRNRRTLELLWQGLWSYIREHKISVMVGCASFPGADPQAHAVALSFLHHSALAPQEWRVRAHEHLRIAMEMIPDSRICPREVLKSLPPLIKGYLRLGCLVGDGAVVDHQFGTTDVLMILPVENIDPRYLAHFGPPGERREE